MTCSRTHSSIIGFWKSCRCHPDLNSSINPCSSVTWSYKTSSSGPGDSTHKDLNFLSILSEFILTLLEHFSPVLSAWLFIYLLPFSFLSCMPLFWKGLRWPSDTLSRVGILAAMAPTVGPARCSDCFPELSCSAKCAQFWRSQTDS